MEMGKRRHTFSENRSMTDGRINNLVMISKAVCVLAKYGRMFECFVFIKLK